MGAKPFINIKYSYKLFQPHHSPKLAPSSAKPNLWYHCSCCLLNRTHCLSAALSIPAVTVQIFHLLWNSTCLYLLFICFTGLIFKDYFLKVIKFQAQHLHCPSRQFSSCMNPLVHLPVQYMLCMKGPFFPYHTPVNTSVLSHSKL